MPYEIGVARYREIARGQILGDDSGLLKMLFHREDRRLLGVHAIGTGATELIHIGQAVLALGGGLDYFLQNGLQLPDAGRVLQGRGARRLQQAAPLDSGMAGLSAQKRRSTLGAAVRSAAASRTPRIDAIVGATSS